MPKNDILLFWIKELFVVDTNKGVGVLSATYTIESTWQDIFNREMQPRHGLQSIDIKIENTRYWHFMNLHNADIYKTK